ncbi:hypothetical protein DFH06DRAFT_1292663 [Mycena polygramma]|nr:hypothetical protein DFH06DRAFT_1292663 [Mycena polygramma]
MHPALSEHTLDRLPFTLRVWSECDYLEMRLATAALNGSVKDLSQCSERVKNLPPSQSLLFLPVFYEHLRTDDIPDLDPATYSYTKRQSFERALSALQGLANVRNIPAGAFPELWPRYWRWHELVFALMPSSSDAVCLSFLAFICRFRNDRDCISLVSATPGDSELPPDWFMTLMEVLYQLNPSGPSSLEEYIEEAGGSYDDLASLLLRHILRIAPSRHTELSRLSAPCLLGLVLFVIAVEDVTKGDLELSQNPCKNQPLPLSEALLMLGTPVLTVAACAVSRSHDPTAPSALGSIIRFIGLANRLPRAEIYLAESIKHGLIHALVASARSDFAQDVYPQSKALLRLVLPLCTIHGAILDLLDAAFAEVEDLMRADNFSSTELWPYWQGLVDLVAQRRSLLQRLNPAERLLLKPCANMTCGRIQEAGLFQRCASCRRAYYCSKLCQTTDWRFGGHRDVCSPHSALSINWHYPVPWRDRALLRLLVHQKYESVRWSEIYRRQIVFMYRNPDVAFFTLFTQVWDGFQIKVHPVGTIHDKPFADAEWAAAVTRMKQSAGRMELHVVEIGDGTRTRWWLLPLWMPDARVGDAVAQIVSEIPPGIGIEELLLDEAVPGWEERLNVLGEEGGPVAIH